MVPLGTEKTCRAIISMEAPVTPHGLGQPVNRGFLGACGATWGLIRTQVLYKGIWVWRTFHEEFEVRFVLRNSWGEWKRCISVFFLGKMLQIYCGNSIFRRWIEIISGLRTCYQSSLGCISRDIRFWGNVFWGPQNYRPPLFPTWSMTYCNMFDDFTRRPAKKVYQKIV